MKGEDRVVFLLSILIQDYLDHFKLIFPSEVLFQCCLLSLYLFVRATFAVCTRDLHPACQGFMCTNIAVQKPLVHKTVNLNQV